MKLTLQLKMGQQLTMTPQLQQAIKLLQLSTLDLQQEIQEALDSNPMLELEEDLDGINAPENQHPVPKKAGTRTISLTISPSTVRGTTFTPAFQPAVAATTMITMVISNPAMQKVRRCKTT